MDNFLTVIYDTRWVIVVVVIVTMGACLAVVIDDRNREARRADQLEDEVDELRGDIAYLKVTGGVPRPHRAETIRTIRRATRPPVVALPARQDKSRG